jgi:hypothetical protein
LEKRHQQKRTPKLEAEPAVQLKTQVRSKAEGTALLEAELARLKSLTGLGHPLTVVWHPLVRSPLSGEVKKNVIFIYEEEIGKALITLRHEFIDFLVCLAIKPYEKAAIFYKTMINSLLKKLSEDAYVEKEQVVEGIAKSLMPTRCFEKGR